MADEEIRHGSGSTEVEGTHFLEGEVVVMVGGFVVGEEETAS